MIFSDIAKKSETKHDKCLHGSLHLKRKWLSKKLRENNPSFFIESVYLFLYSLSFSKDIILLGNLNCQSVPCIDHACWYSLLWKSPLLSEVPTQAWIVSPGRLRPFTAFPSRSHCMNSNTVKVQWLVPYGLGWLGIHSLQCSIALLKNLIDNSGAMRTSLNYGVRMSFHEWHNNRLENVIGVPFRTQVCPPHVWLRGLSLWMTWPRPIFDTISLFLTYVYTNLILLLWTLGHIKQFRQQFSKIFQIPGTQWSSIMQFNQFCLSFKDKATV